ncbi:hypothetical protein BaRGS_00011507 [Batillaria attramentaria]|uniref:Small acidic protein n=1 Tax=Batillaria attramentaria TaxID=370345 RepID=A0ABD0LCQ9_9CAEN
MSETKEVNEGGVQKVESNENQSADSQQPTDIQVHSANAWEKADLGDEDRKNKFLKLMGAGKKEHHGRFVIGDHEPSHTRPSKDTENLEHNLEDQYQQSLAHRLAGGRRGHIGLGFHDDEDSSESEKNKDDRQKEKSDDDDPDRGVEGDPGSTGEEEEEEEAGESEAREKEGRDARKKRESTGDSNNGASDTKKMKFVKSSS